MKKALGLNAIFSALSGIPLIAFHHSIAGFFDVTNSTAFWVIGVILVFFSGTILYEMKRQSHSAILWIITQDFLWVIGSIIILVWHPFGISVWGNLIIAIVALIVLAMALNQSKELAKVDNAPGSDKKQLKFERTVSASKSSTWKVISDVANYHKVASNIDTVKILSGERQGMVRQCSHGKDSWTETCSLWQEEKSYSFIVNTSASDFPFPLSYMQGTWEVEEVDTKHTIIKMIFHISYKKRILNVILYPFMKKKFNTVVEDLLDNWQGIVEQKVNHY